MAIVFKSKIAPKLQSFIEYKQALGYSYKTASFTLKQYDSFCLIHGNPDTMTKESVEQWIQQKELTNITEYRSWLSPLREAAKYMHSIGDTNAYILEHKYVIHKYRPQPYLLNEDEINAFFKACDEQVLRKKHQGRHLVMPVFFRFLYCCGVRCGEARLLKTSDVHLSEGYVDIMNSKGFRDRRLFLSEELTELLIKYEKEIQRYFTARKYFFPSTTERCYAMGTIGINFNIFWDTAGLRKPYGKQPRAYSFRHHFAFSNINKWVAEGKDVNAMLPYLMRYMGHSSLKSTYYYIHVVPEFFQTFNSLTIELESLIPEVTAYEI
jgi:integrase/recombinase XerD